MSQKHESETLRQQRIAREEFLELKKMQSGEIETGPKPSEIAIVPKTPMEKIKNIWYHYSKLIIFGILGFIALVIMVAQCCNRTDYDLKVVYFTYTPVMDEYVNNMGSYLEKFSPDVNGDGEVHIQMVNCACDPNGTNTAFIMKLQAMIAAEPSALLFITDDEAISYFENISSGSIKFFEDEFVAFDEDFYKQMKTEDYNLKKNLKLYLRNIKGTQISKDKEVGPCLKASKEIMKKVSSK